MPPATSVGCHVCVRSNWFLQWFAVTLHSKLPNHRSTDSSPCAIAFSNCPCQRNRPARRPVPVELWNKTSRHQSKWLKTFSKDSNRCLNQNILPKRPYFKPFSQVKSQSAAAPSPSLLDDVTKGAEPASIGSKCPWPWAESALTWIITGLLTPKITTNGGLQRPAILPSV